jgi:predicted transcriptional regulator
MPEPLSPLMVEFLAWVSSRHRTYTEAMEAWQTSCPRHTIWEDALIDGLIQVKSNGLRHESEVTLTPRGKAILNETSEVDRN